MAFLVAGNPKGPGINSPATDCESRIREIFKNLHPDADKLVVELHLRKPFRLSEGNWIFDFSVSEKKEIRISIGKIEKDKNRGGDRSFTAIFEEVDGFKLKNMQRVESVCDEKGSLPFVKHHLTFGCLRFKARILFN